MHKDDLTAADIALLEKLALRQHETEADESKIRSMLLRKADDFDRIWKAFFGLVSLIVAATIYVLTIRFDITRNAYEIQYLRGEMQRANDRIETLRLEMKDKADRRSP